MGRALLLGVLLSGVLLVQGCGPSQGNPSKESLADRITGDDAGPLLAQAYREHTPTIEEQRFALLVLVALVRSQETGRVEPLLLNPSVQSRWAEIAGNYGAFRTQERGAVSLAGFASLSGQTFNCGGSCLPDTQKLLRSAARLASRLTPAKSITEVGAIARLVLNLTARRDIGTALVEQLTGIVAESLTDDELVESLDKLGRALIPSAALVQYGLDTGLLEAGTTLLPAVVAETAAVIAAFGLGYALAAELTSVYREYTQCKAWQETTCTPDTGTPDGGEPDAGMVDGGTPDAGSPDAGVGRTEPGHLRLHMRCVGATKDFVDIEPNVATWEGVVHLQYYVGASSCTSNQPGGQYHRLNMDSSLTYDGKDDSLNGTLSAEYTVSSDQSDCVMVPGTFTVTLALNRLVIAGPYTSVSPVSGSAHCPITMKLERISP